MNVDSSAWREAEDVARAALAAHPDTVVLARANFRPIPGSVSNFAWHALAADRENFVRLARMGSESLGADLAAEAAILRCVAAAGLAPPVVRCDPATRLLVTQWIEPGQPMQATMRDAASIAQVAAMMARLHRLAVPATLRRIRFDEQARRLEAAQQGLPSPFKTTAADVFAQLGDRDAGVLCHHDIHAQNVVVDALGRLWLVDWEYAGLGDPVFDLASFASQCELGADATRVLCDRYIHAGGSVEWTRLGLARWAFDYVQWLWYRGLQAAGVPGPDHAEAAERLHRIELRLRERAIGGLALR